MARLLGGFGRIGREFPTQSQVHAAAVANRQANRPRGIHGAALVQAIISEMANVMVDRRNANDNCTDVDLKRHGFTDAEIAEFGQRASERARRLTRDVKVA